jgi:hypothetical protein
MNSNYTGLTQSYWIGTWSAPNGAYPVVLDTEMRGGLRTITADAGETLTDISGLFLQDGMLVYVQKDYISTGGIPYTGGMYYKYTNTGYRSTTSPRGILANGDSYWTVFPTGGGSSISLSPANSNQVLFNNSGSIDSNVGLVYNASSHYLGINQLNPTKNLDVDGDAYIGGLTVYNQTVNTDLTVNHDLHVLHDEIVDHDLHVHGSFGAMGLAYFKKDIWTQSNLWAKDISINKTNLPAAITLYVTDLPIVDNVVSGYYGPAYVLTFNSQYNLNTIVDINSNTAGGGSWIFAFSGFDSYPGTNITFKNFPQTGSDNSSSATLWALLKDGTVQSLSGYDNGDPAFAPYTPKSPVSWNWDGFKWSPSSTNYLTSTKLNQDGSAIFSSGLASIDKYGSLKAVNFKPESYITTAQTGQFYPSIGKLHWFRLLIVL